MSRLALALVTLLIICSKVASSDQSNLLTVGGSSHYIITSEERDAAPEQLVPFTFADPRGGDIHNVTIHIDFCSQCGVVNLYLRRYSEPTRSIFEYERTIASTGTATSPATIIIKDISAHSESSSRSAPKIFMGLGFEEPECSFWLTVFNASYLTRHEGAHGAYFRLSVSLSNACSRRAVNSFRFEKHKLHRHSRRLIAHNPGALHPWSNVCSSFLGPIFD